MSVTYKNVILYNPEDNTEKWFPITTANNVYLQQTNGDIPLTSVLHPIGSIYMSFTSTSPASMFGGTWTQITGYFLLGTDDTFDSNGNVVTTGTYHIGTTGGSPDAVLVEHNHTITQNVNGTIQYRNNGVIYGNGYTSAPGSASGNISLSSNSNGALGNWAGGGSSQRGRDVYAKFSIPAFAMDSAGGSGTGANMPPYICVYAWKRVS